MVGNSSGSGSSSRLTAITQPPEVGFDGLLQLRGLGKLGVQFGNEARHFFLKGVAVVFDFLGADVAAGGEDVAVGGDFCGGGGFAEAGDVCIGCGPLSPALSREGRGGKAVTTPGVISIRDSCYVRIGEFSMDSIDQCAEFSRVNEKRFAFAFATLGFGLALR